MVTASIRYASTKLAILLLAIPSALPADTIYKTVDENGKISYSSTPLPGRPSVMPPDRPVTLPTQ